MRDVLQKATSGYDSSSNICVTCLSLCIKWMLVLLFVVSRLIFSTSFPNYILILVITLQIDLMKYDPKASATGKSVSCDEEFCLLNTPYSDCRTGMPCYFQVSYGDGSSTAGFFVKDDIQFEQVSGDLQTTLMNGSISFG